MALRTVGVRLTAEIGDYQSKLKAAAQTTKDFKGELDKAAKKGNLDAVAGQAAAVGVGLLGLAAVAIKSAADFDKSMSAVAAATHAPKAEIDQLRAAAIKAGKDTQYSATEAADGITELSKAGVHTADILGGGLKGALSLAAAGQLSVSEASETAASAMTQFGLKGAEIPHVADLLAAAAGKAQGSVHDMGYALNQSGLVAAQFGLSIEDTTGALAEFASAGLTGSDAGTSLKTMLLAIANPSKQTTNLMNDLGISFYDATGKFIGFNGVAQVLQTRLKGLTDAQRQQALGQIFGNDAIRSASILYTDGAAGVDKWKNAVNDSGYAAATASKLTDNLSGDLERLKGSLETMFIEAGGGANGGLRFFVKALNGIANVLADLPSGITGTLTVLAGLTGAGLLAAAAFVKTRKTLADVNTELVAMGPAGEKAAAGVSRVGSAVSKAAGFFAIWASAMAAADAIADKQQTNVDALSVGLTKFGQGADLSGESARVLGQNLDNLTTGFKFLADTSNSRLQFTAKLQKGLESTVPGLKDYNTSLSNTQAQIDSVDSALAGMVTSGHTSDAAAAFSRLASILAVNGVSMDEFKKKFPSYEAALESSGKVATGTAGKLGDVSSALDVGAGSQTKYATEADQVAGAARGERDALDALHKTLKAETDPVYALIDSQQKLAAAKKTSADATSKYGKNSKEARAADLALSQAALGLQDSVAGLATTFKGKLDPAFVATLKAAGLNQAEIKNVEKAFGDAKKAADKYDGKYAAETSAPGAKQAKKDLDNAYTAANHFAGPYVARLSIDGETAVNSKLDALLVKQRALQTGLSVSSARAAVQKDLDRNRQKAYDGGGWTGPGSKYQPAGIVHADEFVIQKESRAKIEHAAPGLLDLMNVTGQVPRAAFASGELRKMGDLPIGFAGGGHVPWKFAATAAKTKIPSWSEVLSHIPGGEASSFLRAQDGKPYVWASAGPNGYDCSGIVSAVYNLLHGHSPYSHTFSTGSLPGGWFTKPGIGGPLTAAWSNPGEAPASSTTGHMMGMAGGLTFESTGSRGVHLGSTTRRLTDFAHIAHYAQGGHVAMAGGGTISEPVFGVGASGRTYSFGENYQPERVTPMWQAGTHGGGANVTVVLENHGVIGSPAEVNDWLAGAVDTLKRRGRI